MIPISKECLEQLKKNGPQRISIKVTPAVGEPFEMTEKDLRSFDADYKSTALNEITLGDMSAAGIEVQIQNDDGRFNHVVFDGAQLNIDFIIDLPFMKEERIPIGIFNVNRSPRIQDTIGLGASDNLINLDKILSLAIPFPTSIRKIVKYCIEFCGLVCRDYSMFPDTDDVLQTPEDATKVMGCRTMLMHCAEICGVCAYADTNGEVVFGFYHTPEPEHLKDFVISEHNRFALQFEESDTVISGCQCREGDTYYPKEVDPTYVHLVEGNPVFAVLKNKEATAQALSDKIKGFRYRAITAKTVGYPFIRSLDLIPFSENGNVFPVAIMHHHVKLNGNSAYECRAISTAEKNYAPIPIISGAAAGALQEAKKDTEVKISAFEDAVATMNTAMSNALGLYTTTTTLVDGSKVIYQHDKLGVAQSRYIIMTNAAGTAWTDEGWNNGHPKWKYGVSKEGNAILNALYANKVRADCLEGGRIQSLNGKTWINMENGTFNFSDNFVLDDSNNATLRCDRLEALNSEYRFVMRDNQAVLPRLIKAWEKNDIFWPPEKPLSNLKGQALDFMRGNEIIGSLCFTDLRNDEGNAPILSLYSQMFIFDVPGYGTTSVNQYGVNTAGLNISSTEDIKENITEPNAALPILEAAKVYNYNLKSPKSKARSKKKKPNKFGFVIGREVPDELLSEDGKHIDLYNAVSVLWKAVQELSAKLEEK